MSDTDSRDIQEFRSYRERMNERIYESEHLGIKRFFNLDTAAYRDGALDGRTKELLGLVASAVLRCNDCIDYHLDQCVGVGFTDEDILHLVEITAIFNYNVRLATATGLFTNAEYHELGRVPAMDRS